MNTLIAEQMIMTRENVGSCKWVPSSSVWQSCYISHLLSHASTLYLKKHLYFFSTGQHFFPSFPTQFMILLLRKLKKILFRFLFLPQYCVYSNTCTHGVSTQSCIMMEKLFFLPPRGFPSLKLWIPFSSHQCWVFAALIILFLFCIIISPSFYSIIPICLWISCNVSKLKNKVLSISFSISLSTPVLYSICRDFPKERYFLFSQL